MMNFWQRLIRGYYKSACRQDEYEVQEYQKTLDSMVKLLAGDENAAESLHKLTVSYDIIDNNTFLSQLAKNHRTLKDEQMPLLRLEGAIAACYSFLLQEGHSFTPSELMRRSLLDAALFMLACMAVINNKEEDKEIKEQLSRELIENLGNFVDFENTLSSVSNNTDKGCSFSLRAADPGINLK
jgi:hypothetical protein